MFHQYRDFRGDFHLNLKVPFGTLFRFHLHIKLLAAFEIILWYRLDKISLDIDHNLKHFMI